MREIVESLRIFKDVNPDATVACMLLFCYVQRDGYTHVTDLVRITKLGKGTISRQLAVLSDIGRGKKEGLDLIRLLEDPADRRYKIVKLTPKGQEVFDKLASICPTKRNDNNAVRL